MTEFRLLGPVEVWSNGRPLDEPRQRRQVLAALLVDAGRPVTVDTLIARVWGDDPPAQARETLYVHVARLRRSLPSSLVRRSGGYVLDVDRQTVDVFRFHELVGRAGDKPAGERAALLGEAVRLWRGEPLAGLPGPWAEGMRVAWRQAYFDAVVGWTDAEIEIGRPGSVIELLTVLVAEHPLVEPLSAALIRALGAAGRSAEALELFSEMPRRLVEQLGAEPGPELRNAQRQVLDGRAPSRVQPRQLPPDITGFVGRAGEMTALDRVGPAAFAPRVAVLSGPAGVGKSSLAVHWAHTARPGFDGELYVNLRGFDAGGFPADPTDALRSFVEALGVATPDLPPDRDGLVGLYRSLLADRRMLILADNARDAEQVQPLIPGAPGCLVLVTSRDRLEALAVVNTAVLLDLPAFNVEESRLLLRERLGHDRTAVEPVAVDRIVDACAGLPLALAVAAGRAAARPGLPLANLAADLTAESGALSGLTGAAAQADVRSVFSWSYRVVGTEPARLFRLLSVHPGPDVDVGAAAAMAGVSVERAGSLLRELTRLHLLDERPGPRFALHDLLRRYGAEQASDAEERAATRRLLDFYLRTAHEAAWRLYPYRERISIVADTGGPGLAFPDAEAASAWFRAERTVLANAVAHGARLGFDERCWQLAYTLGKYYELQGNRHDWTITLRAGLAAAERLGSAQAHLMCLFGLASSCTRGRHLAEAEIWLRRALDLAGAGDDVAALARAHHNLSNVLFEQRRMADALETSEQAHQLYQSIGDHWGRSATLNSRAGIFTAAGDHDRAVAFARLAIDVAEEATFERGAAYGWNSLGDALYRGGDVERAVAAYRQATDLAHRLGDRYLEADTLAGLGEALAPRSPDEARSAWDEALRIFDELGDPGADKIRSRLRSVAVVGHDS